MAADPARIAIKDIHFFMRNVRTRMPFKYGVATLTSVPILHLRLDGELDNGQVARGWAADILPPKWFDKDPQKEYEDNVDDLIAVARAAAQAYASAAGAPQSVFDIWYAGYHQTLAFGDDNGLNHLTAGHGSSLLERALIDAVGSARGQTYAQMLSTNVLGIDFGRIHDELRGIEPSHVLPEQPLDRIAVRHCVGLADPIRRGDIATSDILEDGLPQALEDYIDEQGLMYFKVKVNGDLDADLERLGDVAALLQARCRDRYSVTLDGNEQYVEMESFQELLAKLESAGSEELARFYDRIIYLEQPLERSVALNKDLATGIRTISERKAMLIDESDGDLDSFKQAVSLGYAGVSSKNCKGLIKALTNQALARHYAEQSDLGRPCFLSGEDLMNLPVVPLHQDLTHAAALGISHVERNGHHYVRGLDHLSASERSACVHGHSTLYSERDGELVALAVESGQIDVSSLQVPGLGSGPDVDADSMIPLEEWSFASL